MSKIDWFICGIFLMAMAGLIGARLTGIIPTLNPEQFVCSPKKLIIGSDECVWMCGETNHYTERACDINWETVDRNDHES